MIIEKNLKLIKLRGRVQLDTDLELHARSHCINKKKVIRPLIFSGILYILDVSYLFIEDKLVLHVTLRDKIMLSLK